MRNKIVPILWKVYLIQYSGLTDDKEFYLGSRKQLEVRSGSQIIFVSLRMTYFLQAYQSNLTHTLPTHRYCS